MKKLFKEVWKSFSGSKVILIGLIILIFLSSGIITLIFDVVNSYTNQYDKFNKASIRQDITMNSNFNLYGNSPDIFYEENIDYDNNKNLVNNQWRYYQTNNYANSININTNSEYYNLKSLIPNYSTDVYVKTKDLSTILNTNLNLGNISLDESIQADKMNITLNSTGNNFIQTYDYKNNEFISRNQIYDSFSNLYDVYDENTKQWTSSKNPQNLFINNEFSAIVIDIEENKAYTEYSLKNNSSTTEGQKYINKKDLFFIIDSNIVANMLGFKKSGFIITTWRIDTTKTWILDGDINNYKDMEAKVFFQQTSLPFLKNIIELPEAIQTINSLEIPTSFFVYSRYEYTFTRNQYKLKGITKELNDYSIDKNIWIGYFGEWLEHIKNNDKEYFEKIFKSTIWTKEVKVFDVDKSGNIVFTRDQNGLLLNTYNELNFNPNLELEDIVLNIEKTTNDGNKLISTIQQIEIPNNTSNIPDLSLFELISNNHLSTYENEIKINSKNYKYNQFYKEVERLVDKVGLRETLTVNDNSTITNNVYQFINLGNSQNEITWNNLEIQQNVGKLIETGLNNPIFSQKPSVNNKQKNVPIEYVPKIIEKLLNGLSLNREYINPTLSYSGFSYINENNEIIELNGKKIIWLTKKGLSNINDIYGITSINMNISGNLVKKYFILKSSIPELNNNQIWTPISEFNFGFTFEELEKYIINNELNFAPFDWRGNQTQIVSSKGWARQDTNYLDHYSIPFQYLLPQSKLVDDYNQAISNPSSNKFGMESFRDNLINTLTLSIKPLISSSNWVALMNGINTAFSNYGFAQKLSDEAPEFDRATFIKIIIGVLRDATINTNENLFESLFSNIIEGIKRFINPDGNTPIETQKITLEIELSKLFNIIELSTGAPINFNFIFDIILKLTGIQVEKLSDLIKDPTLFLDGLKIFLSSIDIDRTLIEFWNEFYIKNNILNNQKTNKQTIGTGDFLPYIYKNIYSIVEFKRGLKQIISSTILNDVKIADVLTSLKPILPPEIQNQLGLITILLGNDTIPVIIDWLEMWDQQNGFNYLKSKVKSKITSIGNTSIQYTTINLYDFLTLFKLNVKKIFPIELNSFISPDDPTKDMDIIYNPDEIVKLELDMDLVWYLNNYVLKDNKGENSTIFGIDVSNFLTHSINAITEVKEDYNQIVLNENLGKLAIVNQAFLNDNNKEIYNSQNLEIDLEDLSKINEKYKINISGLEYLIIGSDFTIDYLYPVIDSSNLSVNTKNQALVYVNEYGYDRIKRSNPNSSQENYFLLKINENQNIIEAQTKLNQLIYLFSTGKTYTGSNINDDSNTYKLAYLYNETSLLNPERSLRLSIIDDLISNLNFIEKSVGLTLFLIVSIVIIFVIRRYIGSRSKVLGVLKAQGYTSLEISLSICLFPLFVSIIGASIGYIGGLFSQIPIFNLLSIFWKIPFVTIPFNLITFIITLIIPIIFLCALTIFTTCWFLYKNKSISIINGSLEINNSAFASKVHKITSNVSVKNKFSISLTLSSLGKLSALFISTLFTTCITLFFITSYKSFDNSINRTYSYKNYKYSMKYITPTIEGGKITSYRLTNNINDLNSINLNNSLYVPVGSASEGYVYLANYFKPGYNEVINKDNLNGNVDINDTSTPHIFTKSSVDLTISIGGITMNVWDNFYNALPESQKIIISNTSDQASKWMEWTQEGVDYLLNGKTYLTRFTNDESGNKYLSLWDNENNDFVKINFNNQLENIKINYFEYHSNNQILENSKFIYKEFNKESNKYNSVDLIITNDKKSNELRAEYRKFLVNAYNIMLNFDSNNIISNKLDVNLRTNMPNFSIDYFVSPGAQFLSYDEELNQNDEKFTYLETSNINGNMQPEIIGYDINSKYIKVMDSNSNNLLMEIESFNELNVIPLIINNVVSQKYNLNIGSILELKVKNSFTRYQDKLIEKLNLSTKMNIKENIYKFKVIGISDTYINEEWITSKQQANSVLGLDNDYYNGIMSNNINPIPLLNNLPLYSYNGYWSADNKIISYDSILTLNDSEKQKIINVYKQLFYNLDSSQKNISLFSENIQRVLPNLSNDEINKIIMNYLNLSDLNLTFNPGSNDSNENKLNVEKANESIKKFIDIYSDDSLISLFLSATSQGVERDFIMNASSTINQGMLIILSISFVISLTILIMISSMIINENERNIAIFGILGYTTKEKLIMFFSIYIPIIVISILLSILIIWLFIPTFLNGILAATSILLPINLSFLNILISGIIVLFIFSITCFVTWIIQGRINPIILLKEV